MIYLACRDTFPPPLPNLNRELALHVRPIYWATQSHLNGGSSQIPPSPTLAGYVRELARSARDGNPAHPVWGTTQPIQAGTPVILDLDWWFQAPQNYLGDAMEPIYRAFKEVAPDILLAGYNQPATPIADFTVPPYISVEDYAARRKALKYDLVNRWLDIIPIRCTFGPDRAESMLDWFPVAANTVRAVNPGKLIYGWIRTEFDGGTEYSDEYAHRLAKRLMVESGVDGVIIYSYASKILRMAEICAQYVTTPPRPPVRGGRPATRGAFVP